MKTVAQLCALLMIAFIVRCGQNSRQNTLIIGITQSIATLDPAMHRDRTTESVHRNIFDGLVTRDTSMAVVPELAESWELIDDRTWEFVLRRGVTFHNGDTLTAEDVKFTFDRILQPQSISGRSSPRKGLLGSLHSVEVLGDYRVRLITSEPYPTLLAMLPFHEIVPKKYIEEVGDAYFAEFPVGTGPFCFVEWRKGEHIILKKWNNYYGGAPSIPPIGPARIDNLIFRPIPETATRVAALKAGECTLIQSLPPHLIDTIIEDARANVLTCSGTRSYYIGMNCTRPPFDNLLVRRAMNYAVDMQKIVATILEDAAVVLAGPLVQETFGHDHALPCYSQNADSVRSLLARAEIEDALVFELDCTQEFVEIASAVAAQLAQFGIDARVRVWEWGVLRAELERRNRTCFITSWGNASLDPVGILNPALHSEGRGNYTGYANPSVDSLLERALGIMDGRERESIYHKAERIIHTQAPWIFGFSMKELYAARREVHNWRPTPDGRMNMHDVMLKQSNSYSGEH